MARRVLHSSKQALRGGVLETGVWFYELARQFEVIVNN